MTTSAVELRIIHSKPERAKGAYPPRTSWRSSPSPKAREHPAVVLAAERERRLAVAGLDAEDRLVLLLAGEVADLHEHHRPDRRAGLGPLELAPRRRMQPVAVPALVLGVRGGEGAVGGADVR